MEQNVGNCLPKECFDPLEEGYPEKIYLNRSNSVFRDSWRKLKRNRAAKLSFFFLLFFIFTAVLSIWWTPHDPIKQNINYSNLPPKMPGVEINGLNGTAIVANKRVDVYKKHGVPSSVHFLFGTDNFGRDVLSRLMVGIRNSLTIALLYVVLVLIIGVSYGLVSGYYGGQIDLILQRILEIISGIPNLVIMVLLLLVLKPGLFSIICSLSITGWTTMARVVRAETMKLKVEEFVLVARTLGESDFKVAIKHILPNIFGIILIQVMFNIPSAIFFEAFLSFIGLGLPAPNPSLGTMLNTGYQTYLYLPYLMWIPAIVLSIIMICFNLLADGLRDALDPKISYK
ncbi:ABC transporter permease [Sporolactobacillus spathodeae]|uniref:Oligopeptide transport system permease protein n=1 Tax=Sporolactobacillus spathodeae TaxID=1465502 RepID=A0ABS2QDB3_9BACL|nr:ABC transporter permease [Sporolactobacillus spathodeae]MBM7658932.1 oligopeptide transport system permease protein [Sporolactobacillus spathodeae]